MSVTAYRLDTQFKSIFSAVLALFKVTDTHFQWCPVSIPQHGQHHTCRNMSDIAKAILHIQFGPTHWLILNLWGKVCINNCIFYLVPNVWNIHNEINWVYTVYLKKHFSLNKQSVLWCDYVFFFVQIWTCGSIRPKRDAEIRTNAVLVQFLSNDWLVYYMNMSIKSINIHTKTIDPFQAFFLGPWSNEDGLNSSCRSFLIPSGSI